MFPFLESIKVSNGVLQNIGWHNKRLNETRRAMLGAKDSWNLQELIQLPNLDSSVVYKCRVEYDTMIRKVEFLPYTKRNIKTVQLIESSDADYTYKCLDRSSIDRLKPLKGDADDFIIVKKGFLTDASFANLAFFNGERWVTPSTFLLNGTKRQQYLASGVLSTEDIKVDDLRRFSVVRMINAMIDLEESLDIDVQNIWLPK